MHELRVHRLDLIGGRRTIDFPEGFSVIRGSITTGKTTVVRLLRALLGRVPNHLPPETGVVRSVRGRVTFGSELWEIDRPLVTTKSAVVSLSRREPADDEDDVAHELIADTLRLPAERPTSTVPLTYQDWLLARLGIPSVAVPRARTDITSETSPVTINDWLLYCIVRDDEIDTAVFGHKDTFTDRKRRAVFEINYGIYSAEVADLQAQLRSVELRLEDLDRSNDAVRAFLKDTPFSSLDDIDEQTTVVRDAISEISAQAQSVASAGLAETQSRRLRAQISDVEQRLVSAAAAERAAARSRAELDDLHQTLSTQSERLTRAIVADEWLVDFDFVVCPRCGTSIEPSRSDEDHCYLCLQTPHQSGFHDELVVEQERIASQMVETQSLAELRDDELAALRSERERLEQEAVLANAELDRRTAEFLSQRAESLVVAAGQRAGLEARLLQLTEYRQLLIRYTDLEGQRAALEDERADLVDALAQHERLGTRAEELIRALEARFLEYLQRLHVSLSDLPLTAAINRATYLPVVTERPFDELSSQGLTVLVNVAHALAHHTVSLDNDLPLPSLLVLDGLSNNVGHEGFDLERRDDTYRLLMDEVARYGGRLQVIALDNDVPAFADDAIVLTLSPDDRLIRTEAAQLDEQGGESFGRDEDEATGAPSERS
ncbi:MAG: hypothetical protein R2754_18420 [Microthrixaceae bacterium]